MRMLEFQCILPLKSFCEDVHISLKIDNVTAVSYINNMSRSHSKPCNTAIEMRGHHACVTRFSKHMEY